MDLKFVCIFVLVTFFAVDGNPVGHNYARQFPHQGLAPSNYPGSPYIYLGRQDLPSIYPVVALNPGGSLFRPFSINFINRNEVIDRLIARLNSLRGRPGQSAASPSTLSASTSSTGSTTNQDSPLNTQAAASGIFNDALLQTVATTEEFLNLMGQGVRDVLSSQPTNPTEVVEAVSYRDGYLLKQADGSILYTRDVPVGEALDQSGAVVVGNMAPSRPNLATRFRQAVYNEDPQIPATLSGPSFQNVLTPVPPTYIW